MFRARGSRHIIYIYIYIFVFGFSNTTSALTHSVGSVTFWITSSFSMASNSSLSRSRRAYGMRRGGHTTGGTEGLSWKRHSPGKQSDAFKHISKLFHHGCVCVIGFASTSCIILTRFKSRHALKPNRGGAFVWTMSKPIMAVFSPCLHVPSAFILCPP